MNKLRAELIELSNNDLFSIEYKKDCINIANNGSLYQVQALIHEIDEIITGMTNG